MRLPEIPVGFQICVVLSLLHLPLQCHAGDTFNGGFFGDGELPPNFSEQAESSGFTETGFSFNGDQVPVNLHPIDRIYALNESIFKPSLQVDVHFVHFEEKKPPSLVQATIEHEHFPYVNLESVEPFLAEPVTCRMARPDEETSLDLHFETDQAFEMAQTHWAAENATIRFIVEGLHCFEAAGSRSVYHATGIAFGQARKVVIKAIPLHAAVYWGSDWGHTLRLRNLAPPTEHHILPRQSLSISHDLTRLKRRGIGAHFDWKRFGVAVHVTHTFDKGQDWGHRHQFFEKPGWYNGPFLNFTCIDCHARGAWQGFFDVEINISPFGNKEGCKHQKTAQRKRSPEAVEFHEQHASIQPLIYARMEAERVLRHRLNLLQVHKLRKRGDMYHPILEDQACTEEDPTFPVCHESQLPRALQERSDGTIGPCNQFLRPMRAIGKAAVCAFKHLIGHGQECGEKWKTDLEEIFEGGLKEYMKQLIKTHLKKVEIALHVFEDIDIQFQLEISGNVGLSFWFDVDLATQRITLCPNPDTGLIPCDIPQLPVAPNIGWFVSLGGGSPAGTTLGSLPVGRIEGEVGADGKKGAAKWDPLSNKMLPARSRQEAYVGGAPEADRIQSPTSNSAGPEKQGLSWPYPILDIVPMRISSSVAVDVAFTATLPGFRIFMPKGGHMKWRPLVENKEERFENSISMTTEYLEAKLGIGNPTVTIRLSAGPAVKFKLIPMLDAAKDDFGATGISDPLAMGAHFQPVRFDHIFSLAGPDDPDNCAKNAVKYEMVFRFGMDAYVMVFFQRVADLSWIGNLQQSSIASEMVRGAWISKRVYVKCLSIQFDIEDANKRLNERLSEIQQPIKEKVAKIGQWVSEQANRPVGFEHGVQSWRPNNDSSREIIELMDWMHFVSTSEPHLKWKDCDASHIGAGCNTSDPFLVADNSGCLEPGMCDPWSKFYIPEGVLEAVQKTYDDWMRSHGIDPTTLNITTVDDLYNMSVNYNSSTVIPSPATLPVPSPLPSDPSILSDWQDGLNHNASAVSAVASNTTLSPSTSTTAFDPTKPDAIIGGINYETDTAAPDPTISV